MLCRRGKSAAEKKGYGPPHGFQKPIAVDAIASCGAGRYRLPLLSNKVPAGAPLLTAARRCTFLELICSAPGLVCLRHGDTEVVF